MYLLWKLQADALYLQEKTIANWVGLQVINEIRIGLLKPATSAHATQKTTALNKEWLWQAYVSTTPNPHIKKIHVDVYRKLGHQPLITLISYRYDT